MSLIPTDVGRPIDDVTLKIDQIAHRAEKARKCSTGLRPFETEVKAKGRPVVPHADFALPDAR